MCCFDAFIDKHGLDDPVLAQLAVIVRGADTERHDMHPVCAGLHALSLGLSRNFVDDHAMLAQGMVMYGALHAWLKQGQAERYTWNYPT